MSFGNPNPQPLNIGLQSQQLANNEQGVPVPYIAGTRRVAVKWMSPVYNLRNSAINGGKKGSSKKGGSSDPSMYNFWGTIAGGICIGPLDALIGVVINGDDAWPNAGQGWQTGQTFSPGDMCIYDAQVWVAQSNMGTNTAATSANAPGEVDGSNNPYWEEFQFTSSAAGNSPAWASGQQYNLGAQVTYNGSIWECVVGGTAVAGTSGNAPPNSDYWKYIGSSNPLNESFWEAGKEYLAGLSEVAYNGRAYICVQNNIGTAPTSGNEPGSGMDWDLLAAATSSYCDDLTITPPNNLGPTKKNTTGIPTTWGTLRIYWGLPGQTQDVQFLSAANNNFHHNHPAYTGMAYIILCDFYLGQGNNTAPNVELIVSRSPQQSIVTGAAAGLSDGQANLIAVMAEILSN